MAKKKLDLSHLSLYDLRKEYVRRVGGISRDDETLPDTCIIIKNNIVFESRSILDQIEMEKFVEQLKNS
jgi:hypothetical protein